MKSNDQKRMILQKYVKNKGLYKHALAVSFAMGELADYFKEDIQLWETVGLFHDMDWELTKENPKNHAKKTTEILLHEKITDERIHNAILSHNFAYNDHNAPNSRLEWSLYCCDELTGLIIATALVQPNKKLSSVTIKSILKKFNSHNFAMAVDREQIKICEEKLHITLNSFIEIILRGLQKNALDLGL